MGLQILLLHDLRDGRNMVWATEMDDEEKVDIFAEMQATLAKADASYRQNRHD